MTLAVVMAGLAIAVLFTQAIGALVAPVFLAANLLIVVYPVHQWLTRRHVPRAVSATVAGSLVAFTLVSFLGAITWSLSQLIWVLPSYGPQFNALYDSVIGWLTEWGIHEATLINDLQNVSPSSVIAVITPVFANVWSMIGLGAVLAAGLLVMTMDTVLIDRRLELTAMVRPHIVTALRDFSAAVRRYWVVSTVFGLICAALDVAGLWIIGVPLAAVWGFLAFLMNYIPNVGFILGLVPPTLLALLALGPGKAALVVAVYLVINVIVQSGIMPRYTGAAVGITPTLTFLSLLFWAWVLGPMGALLAVPMTMLVKSLLVDADPDARWVNFLIASDPKAGASAPPSPPQ